jgi:hypothetical protein
MSCVNSAFSVIGKYFLALSLHDWKNEQKKNQRETEVKKTEKKQE